MTDLLGTAREKSRVRYRDGYRVARVIDWWGFVLKALGFFAGAIFGLLAASIAERSGADSGGVGLAGVSVAIVFGVVFWVAGVLIQARAQTMKAHFDEAVYACPFLSDDDKAKVVFPSLNTAD